MRPRLIPGVLLRDYHGIRHWRSFTYIREDSRNAMMGGAWVPDCRLGGAYQAADALPTVEGDQSETNCTLCLMGRAP